MLKIIHILVLVKTLMNLLLIMLIKLFYHARISKYKNIFAKGYTTNWSEEVFVISKTKNTVEW